MGHLRHIILFLFSALPLATHSQEISSYNDYLTNEISVNPAFTGKENSKIFQLSHRQQWIGFGTNSGLDILSAQTRIINSGLGFQLYYDHNGPTSRISGKASYAFHIPVYRRGFSRQNEKGTNLALGFSVSGFKSWLDRGSLNTYDAGVPVMNRSFISPFLFDADLGACLYSPHFIVSLSAYQVLEPVVSYAGLNSHYLLLRSYLLYSSYNFNINNQYILEPYLLLKLSERFDMQLDIGSKFCFSNKFWIALGLKNMKNKNTNFNSSLRAFFGFKIMDNLSGTYSFDYNLNGLALNTFGSHEISLIYKIPNKTVCPSFDEPSVKPSKWKRIFR